jgi:hypothetical protein
LQRSTDYKEYGKYIIEDLHQLRLLMGVRTYGETTPDLLI